MNDEAKTLRGRLMLFTACTAAALTTGVVVARAQTMVTPTPITIPGEGTPSGDLNAYQIKKIHILYQKLLLKEKDLPSAISHVTAVQIAAQGELGSVQSVLKETPSVNEYQSGPGQGVPVLTIRGVRLYELEETLDGNPMSDILSGGQGSFLSNNIGSPVTLDQLGSTTVYPGVAPPDDQGFGSGGGTIAYTTKDPSNEKSAEIFAGYGSFDTSHAGFELNTGPLSDGIDAAKALLRYDQGYTNGYDDDTNERYGDMMFKVVKPYDDGLSKISATVIYNRGFGYINTAPLPIPLIQQYGYSYNFPKSLTFTSENDRYLTAIINDETYVNQNLILSGSLFYNRTAQTFLSYQNPDSINYNPAFPYQITFQVPYFATGAIGPTSQSLGVATVANPTIGGYFNYDPLIFFPGGGITGAENTTDPTSGEPYADETSGYAYGESAEVSQTTTNTIGFSPRATIFLNSDFVDNTIKIGGLIAKENSQGGNGNGSAGGYDYYYGNVNVPQESGYNEATLGGGAQRTVYQGYIQDEIDLLHNTLHFQPAVTVAAAYTSVINNLSFDYPNEKLENFNSIAEPYFGASYDLPDHFVAYASYGKGGYFAPVGNYAENDVDNVLSLSTQRPEIVHQYEAGLRYDTSTLYANIDAYYQKITDADSFFVNYSTGASDFGNFGAEQFRGYEADTKYMITPALGISGNASYTDARYLNSYFANDTPFEDQFGYVFKGDPLASVPNWLANIGIDYNKDNFGAHFEEQYTGSQFITYDFQPTLTYAGPNVTNNPGCPEGTNIPNQCLGLATVPDSKNQSLLKELIGGPLPLITQPHYLISNLLLTYDLPLHNFPIQKLHFALNLQNIFDDHYIEHLYSSYAEIPNGSGGYAITQAYNSAFYGAPRSITLEVSAKF